MFGLWPSQPKLAHAADAGPASATLDPTTAAAAPSASARRRRPLRVMTAVGMRNMKTSPVRRRGDRTPLRKTMTVLPNLGGRGTVSSLALGGLFLRNASTAPSA